MRLTILMTTYNCAPYIGQAIRSILNQTYKDFEFLIVDDGSTDNTEEIINHFHDNRIRYIKQEHFGRSAALNYGLKNASFDTIALMDADDIAHPLRLEKQFSLLSGKKNEISFTDAAYFQKDRIKYVVKNEFTSSKLNKILALHGHFTNSTFLFNKNHILKYGGFDESLQVFEDYDLWLRLKDSSKFIFVNEVLQFARLRKDSLTKSSTNILNQKFYEIQKPYYKDLKISFDIDELSKQNEIRGWREFFYGNKGLCRNYWVKIKLNNWDYRMFLAYLISFLPSSIVNYFKEQRIRLRLKYLFTKNSKFNGLEKEFQNLLKVVSEK